MGISKITTLELEELRVRVLALGKIEHRIIELEDDITGKVKELSKLEKKFKSEHIDVERLKNDSLYTTLYRIIGKYEDKLEKEEKELLEAKLSLDEMNESIAYLRLELEKYTSKRDITRREEIEYRLIMNERKAIVEQSSNNEKFLGYIAIEEKIDNLEESKVHIKEAISAAYDVYRTASQAASHLGSADSIATYDIFFKGGILTHMAKYEHIDDASKLLNELQAKIRTLSKELNDIKAHMNLSIDISSGDRLVDYWFDNIFTDYSIRTKIRDNKDEIDKLVVSVSKTINKLEKRLTDVDGDIARERHRLEKLLIEIDFS